MEDERPVDGVALEPHRLLESVKALGLRLLLNRAQAIIHKSIHILNKEIIEYKMNEPVHRAAFEVIIRSVRVDLNPIIDDDEGRVPS